MTTEHTVGRSRNNRLRIRSPKASGFHALLRWTGGVWSVKDLGSRNGTWLGTARLQAGASLALSRGVSLAFGDERDRWKVVDLNPPDVLAISSVRELHGEDGLLLLGETLICPDDEGQWAIYQGAARHPLEDEDAVTVGGVTWQLFLPGPPAETHAATTAARDLADCTAHFSVSADEENVVLLVEAGPETIRVPNRAFSYLLLDLARSRLEDAEDGTSGAAEVGWRYIDEVARRHQTPQTHINVRIYRARRALAKLGLPGAQDVVERRQGSGRIRFGIPRITVRRAGDEP